jgi:hypothetical protein
LCQDGALRLSALHSALALHGCRLVAIGCSLEDAREFVAARHFVGLVAVDELKAAHAAVGCGVEGVLGFFKPQVWLAFARAVRMGLAVKPTRGEYAQLGATFVCDTAAPEQKWCFAHRQRHWADHPDAAEVLAAVEMASLARLCSHGAIVRGADDWVLRRCPAAPPERITLHWWPALALFLLAAGLPLMLAR